MFAGRLTRAAQESLKEELESTKVEVCSEETTLSESLTEILNGRAFESRAP